MAAVGGADPGVSLAGTSAMASTGIDAIPFTVLGLGLFVIGMIGRRRILKRRWWDMSGAASLVTRRSGSLPPLCQPGLGHAERRKTGAATPQGTVSGEGGDAVGPIMDELLHDDAAGLAPDFGS